MMRKPERCPRCKKPWDNPHRFIKHKCTDGCVEQHYQCQWCGASAIGESEFHDADWADFDPTKVDIDVVLL